MNKFAPLFSMMVVAAALGSCANQASEEKGSSKNHVMESNTLVGLWQQMDINEVLDEEGNVTFQTQVPRSKYKCIMPNGTYFLMEVEPESGAAGALTKILHYGSYTLEGDTLQIEHIESCFDVPELNGHDSYVRYNLPDDETLTLYYKFGVETSHPGSSEWNQEVWRRVLMVQ